MHPNSSFWWEDREAMEDFVRHRGLATIFAATPDGPRAAHVPVLPTGDGALQFHLARGNALTRHLEGLTALAVVNGPDAYISPNFYENPNMVPTWNYLAVEMEGRVRRMDRDGLVALLDEVTAYHEERLHPESAWTRQKMDPKVFSRMCDAIVGFEMEVQAWRGTMKLGQNKPEAIRRKAADALEAIGSRSIAHLMRGTLVAQK